MPTTARSSPNIASVMPALRAEAVWLAIQYSQPLVTLTATYNNSLTKGLNAPSAITSLTLCQVRLSNAGSFARYFQKLLTSSTLRVRLMSLNTARTCGAALAYSIGLGRLLDSSPEPQHCDSAAPTLPSPAGGGRVGWGHREYDMTHAFSDQEIPVCAPP